MHLFYDIRTIPWLNDIIKYTNLFNHPPFLTSLGREGGLYLLPLHVRPIVTVYVLYYTTLYALYYSICVYTIVFNNYRGRYR